MNIEIKKSVKPVNYIDAINIMEERLEQIFNNKEKELIWTLEHEEIYTAGTSYSKTDIIDKSIEIIETNRGGKITCHGPGQLIFYFVLDLRNKKDIRKFINSIEKTIIETFKTFELIRAKFVEKSPCSEFLGIESVNLEKSRSENLLSSNKEIFILSSITSLLKLRT